MNCRIAFPNDNIAGPEAFHEQGLFAKHGSDDEHEDPDYKQRL